MENTKYLVDDEGNVLRELSDNYKILTNGQVEFISETEEIKYHFVKVNYTVVDYLKDIVSVVKLLKYIEFGTGILKYQNGRRIKKTCDLGKKLSDNKNVGSRKVKALIDDDVIHKCKDIEGNYFVFNPYIAHSGRRMPKSLINEFKVSKWRRYTNEDY